ncbi:MAG: Hsp20/alpha crystallin family protein [Candidatus Jacksonbacteria bacterium]
MPSKSFLAKITGINRGKKKEEDKDDNRILDEIEAQVNAGEPSSLATHSVSDDSKNWVQENYEGQLSIDVYQTEDEFVIKSAVAGVDPKDLDISISNDMITIRGNRHQLEEIVAENYLYQECYWGAFSRSIILPQEVKTQEAQAEFKKGILTIHLPKSKQTQKIQIQIKDEDNRE